MSYNKLKRVKNIKGIKRQQKMQRERAPTNIGAAHLTVPVAYVSIYPFGVVFVWSYLGIGTSFVKVYIVVIIGNLV